MARENKVLTVSYGTFSCRLEGFEDALETLKAITEYLRAVIAEDPEFGASPQSSSSVEALQNVAQSRSAQKVTAGQNDDFITLSAASHPPAGSPSNEHGNTEGLGVPSVEKAKTPPPVEVAHENESPSEPNQTPSSHSGGMRVTRAAQAIMENAPSSENAGKAQQSENHPLHRGSQEPQEDPLPISDRPEVDEAAAAFFSESVSYLEVEAEANEETATPPSTAPSADHHTTTHQPTPSDKTSIVSRSDRFRAATLTELREENHQAARMGASAEHADQGIVEASDGQRSEPQYDAIDEDYPSLESAVNPEPHAEAHSPKLAGTEVPEQDAADASTFDRVESTILPPLDADSSEDMVRLMEALTEKMSDPANEEQRRIFAHLRAAAAAKRTGLTDDIDAQIADPEAAFREDLERAVKQHELTDNTQKPSRRIPLKLVAEQRIDSTSSDPENGLDYFGSPQAGDAPAVPANASFAEFAEQNKVDKLPDLLEAAAAYVVFFERQKHFSRPHLLNRLRQYSKRRFTQEECLRAFGRLLLSGKIEIAPGGLFTVSPDIGFKPETVSTEQAQNDQNSSS